MVYISPNSNVMFLRGVNIDPNYQYTLRFDTLTAQNNFFISKVKPDVVVGGVRTSFTLTEQTYTRVNDNTMRVAIPCDLLRDCNYMMFRNTSYSNKWFYAFINKVEYLNDHTTLVAFSVDVIQTWWFDFDMKQCFVAREHTQTDVVGDNLTAEDVETGEYLYIDANQIDFSDMKVAVLSTTKPDGTKAVGSVYNGVYSGLEAATGIPVYGLPFDININYPLGGSSSVVFNGDPSIYSQTNVNIFGSVSINVIESVANCTLHIEEGYYSINNVQSRCRMKASYNGVSFPINGYADGGLSTFTNPDDGYTYLPFEYLRLYVGTTTYHITIDIPEEYIENLDEFVSPLNDYIKSFNDPSAIINIYQYPAEFDNSTPTTPYRKPHTYFRPTSLTDGYTPKNNKLFTNPYSKIMVSDNNGGFAEYQWELCSSNYFRADVFGSKFGTPCALLVPHNYKGKLYCYDDGLPLSAFPNCSWNSDVYKTWWNQNKASMVTSLIAGTVARGSGALFSVSKGAVASNIIGAGAGIAQNVAKHSDMSAIPPQSCGQTQTETLNLGIGRVGYTVYFVSLHKEMLKIIDDYFTQFGYAIKETKKPNIKDSSANLRPHWNYIQTIGACIVCSSNSGMTSGDISAIKNVFDTGITFWDSNDEVGDYSLDNSPT